MFDLAHEVRLCDADIVHWVVIPPCLIGPWLADGRLSTPGLRLPTSDLMVSLAAQGVMSVVAHHDSVEQANTGLVLSALARLVGAAIAQGTPGVEQLGADGELRAQIIQHLDWAVRYGRVRPVDVAQRFDISVRKLHLLFECEELSFSQTAMSIRARLCALDLQCSDDVTGDIARRWGFADSSHLARTMRRHLGCTPAQVRGRAAWTV
ncbi:helix-turn-helix domain-containing protein [Gordonia sp. NPDC003376]